MFKKTLALIFAISMVLGASASPELDKRSTCQLGNVHGGHCNDDDVCVCN
ncbi:hypothetical protein K492DRAFT_199765 [Lichtheimia hyalospora FSU 10163]|nr:hypothetical protein K492DRAFT_199765 [Lichtheimia hyalospora FSU 10163]